MIDEVQKTELQIYRDEAAKLPLFLIGEEDERLASTWLAMIEKQGFQGMVLDKAERVFQAARELKPAGIFLNLHLSGGHNGLIALDRLKNHKMTRHIPILAIGNGEILPHPFDAEGLQRFYQNQLRPMKLMTLYRE